MSVKNISKTPLNALHRGLGGQMVEYAGWDMPVMFSGIVEEHLAVRERAGLFDASHMARIFLKGPGTAGFLQRTLTNDITRLVDGMGHYTISCNENGGIHDDLIVFKLGGEYLVVANAGNHEKIASHLESLLPDGVEMRDRSEELAMVALQGPKSAEVAEKLSPGLSALKRFFISEAVVGGAKMLVSRTGYTGEDGFEFYPEAAAAADLWRNCLEAGKDLPVASCGLGSRDGLRLEMAYSLYGHELDEETTPWEGNIGWVVRMDKGDFIGRAALEKARASAASRSLVAFTCAGPGVPRQGYTLTVNGREAGIVTSGTYSPCLKTGIGLGFINPGMGDGELALTVRGRSLPAMRTKPPFHKGGSVYGPGKP
jgi:aminomethyltransferase